MQSKAPRAAATTRGICRIMGGFDMASMAHWQTALKLGKMTEWDERAQRFRPALCSGRTCRNVGGYLDLPFCEPCTLALWAVMDEGIPGDAKDAARGGRIMPYLVRKAMADEVQREQDQMEAERARAEFMTKPGIIYYLQVGDLVKIGYSSDLPRRMKQYPPHAILLAQHPGTRETERDMHQKLATKLAKGREWFRVCSEVEAHIENVKATYAQPHLMSKKESIYARAAEEKEWERRGQESMWRLARGDRGQSKRAT